jgi:hypothetical protein
MTKAPATFLDEPEPERTGRFTVEIGPGCWTSSLAPHLLATSSTGTWVTTSGICPPPVAIVVEYR